MGEQSKFTALPVEVKLPTQASRSYNICVQNTIVHFNRKDPPYRFRKDGSYILVHVCIFTANITEGSSDKDKFFEFKQGSALEVIGSPAFISGICFQVYSVTPLDSRQFCGDHSSVLAEY